MLNTRKLLYILPDLTYIAELLPNKKPNTFTIQSFRQINGQFMNEDVFLPDNVEKLFEKLEPEEYQLILPDSMFTNTILSVDETDDKKIVDQLLNTTLPKLGLTKDTHEIDTSVLTQLKGSAKVQVSALEKSLLAPIRLMADRFKVKITSISPVTWTIKSVVSLEPSISVLQIGEYLYTALHYIGIDQATITPLTNIDKVAETIKTLKGTEPNIQTIYMLAGTSTEEKLKNLLSNTLPLQQLTNAGGSDSKMPEFVKQIIEAGMRTLSIEEYPVPQFKLGSTSEQDKEDLETQAKSVDNGSLTTQETKTMSDLPKPNDSTTEEKATTPDTESPKVVIESVGDASPKDKKEVDKPSTPTASEETKKEDKLDKKEAETVSDAVKPTESGVKFEDKKKEEAVESEKKPETTPSLTPKPLGGEAKTPPATKPSIDLTRFTSSASTDKDAKPGTTSTSSKGAPKLQSVKPTTKSKGVNTMLRMLFITVAVFFATVAIGVGVGLAILNITNSRSNPPETPVVITDDTQETAELEPTATPEPVEIDRADLDVLVVNATSKAGHAGSTKTILEDAEYNLVAAGNAKGEYEDGVYILMEEEDQDLVQALSKDSELELVFAEGYETEDSTGKYNAVIVLAE